MRFNTILLAAFLVPALAAPTPDSGLEARGGYHCEPKSHYDEHLKRCVPDKVEPAPEPHCESKDEYYDKWAKKCLPIKKPEPPKPHCENKDEYYDEWAKKCLPIKKPEPPKPHPQQCPEHMRYNPKTMKCYNPARHPSEDNCKWLGKYYNAHENKCEDHKPAPPKPMPPPPKPHCENKDEYYDEHAKKCLPIKKPAPVPPPKPVPQQPPKPHCENKNEYYDEHAKKCLPIKKPEPPKPQPPKPQPQPPKPHCEKKDEYYDEHAKKCLPIHKPAPPKPQECPKGMRYNPKTMKCYSPARHPSEDNCKYLGKYYNAHENKCEDHKPVPVPKPHECPKGMRYNPKTMKCYQPLNHPSKDNCEWAGKYYNEHEHKCVDKHH